MEWTDEGIVLNLHKHGEHDALLDCMTIEHGKHRGFVKAGLSKRQKPLLQPGNRLKLTWRARLEDNLGTYRIDPIHSPLGGLLSNRAALAALSASLAVFATTLPERDRHPDLYNGLKAYIDLLEYSEGDDVIFAAGLVKLEMGILAALGYGINLSECAATGTRKDLCYVSPKSAQAVSRAAGMPYQAKMLPLPDFLLENSHGAITHKDVYDGLTLTGYFLDRYIWAVYGKAQPAARERLVSGLLKTPQL